MKRNDLQQKVLKILTDVDAQRLRPDEAFKMIDDLYVMQAGIMRKKTDYKEEQVSV